MYKELIGKHIKIVHKEGDKIYVDIGLVDDYDAINNVLKLIINTRDREGKISYVSCSTVLKIEVE